MTTTDDDDCSKNIASLILLKKLLTCLNEAETRSSRLLIMGYNNSVISYDGISID